MMRSERCFLTVVMMRERERKKKERDVLWEVFPSFSKVVYYYSFRGVDQLFAAPVVTDLTSPVLKRFVVIWIFLQIYICLCIVFVKRFTPSLIKILIQWNDVYLFLNLYDSLHSFGNRPDLYWASNYTLKLQLFYNYSQMVLLVIVFQITNVLHIFFT